MDTDNRQRQLRHQADVQSQQIERVFSRHQMPAQVTRGTADRRAAQFELRAQLAHGWDKLRTLAQALTQELMAALNSPNVEMDWNEERLQLSMTQEEPPPVPLLDLMASTTDVPPLTAVIGLDENGRSVSLDFSSPNAHHLLIAGEENAGKTSLLRTLAIALAKTNRQAEMQLLIMAPQAERAETAVSPNAYSVLEPLNYLPHLLNPVVYTVEETVDILRFLIGELEYRQEQEMNKPSLVVLIDEADALLTTAENKGERLLARLLQYGAAAGIHLALSSGKAEAFIAKNALRANLPARLVGRTRDAEQARIVSGIEQSQAEYLLGQGDFFHVVGGVATYFQAAYIGDYDLHLTLNELHRKRARPLLAQPFNIRPSLQIEDEDPITFSRPQPFVFDDQPPSPPPLVDEEAAIDGERQLVVNEERLVVHQKPRVVNEPLFAPRESLLLDDDPSGDLDEERPSVSDDAPLFNRPRLFKNGAPSFKTKPRPLKNGAISIKKKIAQPVQKESARPAFVESDPIPSSSWTEPELFPIGDELGDVELNSSFSTPFDDLIYEEYQDE